MTVMVTLSTLIDTQHIVMETMATHPSVTSMFSVIVTTTNGGTNMDVTTSTSTHHATIIHPHGHMMEVVKWNILIETMLTAIRGTFSQGSIWIVIQVTIISDIPSNAANMHKYHYTACRGWQQKIWNKLKHLHFSLWYFWILVNAVTCIQVLKFETKVNILSHSLQQK